MSEEFNDLKAALTEVAPAPDAAARARAIALAMQNFDRLHAAGVAGAVPLASQSGHSAAGAFAHLRRFLGFLALKPVLAASTSVAALAIGIAVILPVTGDLVTGDRLTDDRLTSENSSPVSPANLQAPAPMSRSAPAAAVAPPLAASGADADAKPKAKPKAEAAPSAARAARSMAAAGQAKLAAPAAVSSAAAAGSTAAVAPLAGQATLQRLAAPMSADPSPVAPMAADQNLIAPIAPPPPIMAEPLDLALAGLPDPAVADLAGPDLAGPDLADLAALHQTLGAPLASIPTDMPDLAWGALRQQLDLGHLPAPGPVQLQDLINHFAYGYGAPEGDAGFATTVAVMPTPWNPNSQLVVIGLQGARPAMTERPPLNLVLLVDSSAAMAAPAKLALLQQALTLMLPELRPEDQLAILAYGGAGGLILPPTPGADQPAILQALAKLSAGGQPKAGEAGLALAYRLADEMSGPGEINRVVLASDGNFDLGLADLQPQIALAQAAGTDLSVLALGQSAKDLAEMQALARAGNGTARPIQTLAEARLALSDQLSGPLFAIADQLQLQVEWNPAEVADYRLLAYAAPGPVPQAAAVAAVQPGLSATGLPLSGADPAAPIAAGLQLTAIYEITAAATATATAATAGLADAARSAPMAAPDTGLAPMADALAVLRLRWQASGEGIARLVESPITGLEPASDDSRFAVAIAGFGQLMAEPGALGNWGIADVLALAKTGQAPDPYGARAEAISLMQRAQSLPQ